MKTLIYQCDSGISGDMNLGALVDLGVPAEYLVSELAKLSVSSEFTLEFVRANKKGIWGTKASVELIDSGSRHHHRHYRDIKKLIDESPYNEKVKAIANDIFYEVARAESRIHNEDIDIVHFHEVGATDSIVDILGAALAIDFLNVDQVFCSSLNLGGGTVRCEHGLFPVPAPATAEILRGVECTIGGDEGEFTTPTGAAILKANVSEFSFTGTINIDRIGYGVGDKDFEQPNVLRAIIGTQIGGAGSGVSSNDSPTDSTYCNLSDRINLPPENFEIRANIDDMSPESFEPLLTNLFAIGCQDAFVTPIVMKKSRLAQMLTVLCRARDIDRIISAIYQNSTTIGVRIVPVYKDILTRRNERVSSSFGDVQVKVVELQSGERRWKVEHDDICALADQHDLPYLQLRKLVERDVAKLLDE